ncbi:MAG: hypothetical protein D6814_09250 [Calditrichaeota bacterium]|nr:MAG: hypothetical protein D6814_09250 [Calditrichota bacterium]
MNLKPVHTEDGEIYEVFAKIKDDDPYQHIGSVVAPDPDLAGMYARTLYNEWNWSGMFIAPRREIITLIGPR